MVQAKPRPARKPKAAPPPEAPHAGPSDIADPLLRTEFKRAAVWIGLAAALVLIVYLAQPLLVIFGGMVFAAMIDGGARLIGRVVRIGRLWRVTIVLLLTAAFLMWTAMFAGSQIAAQAAQLPATVQAQALKVIDRIAQRVDF